MNRLTLFVILMLLPLLILANVVPGPRGIKPLFSENILKLQLSQEAMKSIDLPETLTASIDKLGINEIDDIISSYGKAKIYRAHIRLKDKAFENKHGVDRWILVKFENKIDVFSALDACKEKKQWIDWASPETYFYTTAVPNDTYYANNWGHNNTAQLPVYSGGSHSGAGVGTVGFDTDAQLAWDQSQGYGSAAIIIAVIDTGVDTAHPDLRLVTGYDYGDIDADPMDDSDDPGHGTACSGVTAGIANNGLGVTGIAGGCSVMPIKIATSAGTLSGTAIENAQYHIGDNNVDVASMSYGGSYDYGDYPSSDTAYNYAYTHGVVLLAATANDNSSTITYPANHPYVISVGAASPTGQRKSDTSSDGEYWWGSNYGTATMDARDAVDIMAPTILPATDITGTGNGYNTSSDYYMWFNGTSCATPYAAGVAALLLSKEPTLTQAQVRTALTSTATDMTFDGGAGWDRYTGYGLINANNALLSLVPGMPTCTITSPAAGTIFNLNETVTINVTATDSDGTISSVQFYIDDVLQNTDISLPYTWNWDTTGYSGGSYAIKAIATDNSSNSVQNTITVTLLAPADEGFESGGFGAYAWSNISASPWTVQSSVTFSGTYAAKSGVIGNSTSTSLSLPMNVTSAGNISFYQMISSESGYDFLKFYIDGDLQGQWSGGGIWTQQTYAVTSGVRTFTWTYSKDSTTTGGSDCAYLDHIIFPPNEVYFAPPQNLTAIPGNTVVNLAWQAPASGTPTGYDIYKNSIFSTNVMALAYTDNAVVNGTSYSYHLKAVYSEGESEATATVYATPTDAVATEVILGTGTSVTGTSTASPINIYYKSLHGQSVYTAAELIAGGVTGPINITQIGFNVVTLPTLALPNFLIRMKHTSATDVSSWQTATGMSTVYTSASYMPTAGGYDMLTLSTPFLWNGTDNIVIDTAFSPVSDYSSTGTVQYTSLTNGYRYARSDTADQTAIFAGTSTSANRPNVKLTLMPSAAGPLITVDPTSLSFGNVVVNATSTMQFTIQNIGDEELSGSITTPAGYSVALSASKNELIIGSNVRNSNRVVLPFNINAGQSKTYDLSFIPPSVGSFNGNVVISSDAVNFATVNIGVTGNGYIQPTIEVSTTLQSASLIIGAESSETFTISNNGSLSLNYSIGIAEVRSLKNIATSRMLKTDSGKSISGSTFDVNVAEFTPGTTEDWIFTVYNGSDDTEWLKDLYLTFPAGVVVNSVSNFVGGTGGELVPDLTTGSGITINWHGETSGGWGFIQGNESAVATVNVTIAAGNSTPISLDYQLNGDVYGAEPHILTGAIILPPSTPPITWYSASPLSGTIAGGGQQHITGSFSAIGLDIGSYEALLSISSDDPVNPLETVQISLEVTPANSAPTIVLPESFQFDMNESLMVDFSTYVNDVDADELILEYSGNTNIHVAIEGLNVTFTALEDWYGDEELTFTVSDGSEEAFDTVMVTVNQVISYLDAPIVSINREESFVLLEWDAVANANEYWVFRAVTPEEQFVKINETTELSYEDYDELDKAFYQVKAVFVTPLKGN